ncbi:MAG: hypothetical protein MSC43_04575 [Clostridiales bacterium]|nr:hypothetical protein [Clostridiales bacterium]MDD7432593.1 hypothetical protein [Clostridiales bacterium]MDY3061820.1 hypothetical protein [Eubacteriales bacterium]
MKAVRKKSDGSLEEADVRANYAQLAKKAYNHTVQRKFLPEGCKPSSNCSEELLGGIYEIFYRYG